MDAPLCLPFAIELLFFVWDFTFGLFYLAKRNMKVCSCVGPDYIGFPTHRRPYSNQIVKRISLRIHFAKKERTGDEAKTEEDLTSKNCFPLVFRYVRASGAEWMTVQVMIDKCENRHRRRNALSLFSLGPFQGERSRSRPIIAALGESSL